MCPLPMNPIVVIFATNIGADRRHSQDRGTAGFAPRRHMIRGRVAIPGWTPDLRLVTMTDLYAVAADNAATMWLKLGAARGYQPLHGDGFIAVSGADRQGRRIMTLSER